MQCMSIHKTGLFWIIVVFWRNWITINSSGDNVRWTNSAPSYEEFSLIRQQATNRTEWICSENYCECSWATQSSTTLTLPKWPPWQMTVKLCISSIVLFMIVSCRCTNEMLWVLSNWKYSQSVNLENVHRLGPTNSQKGQLLIPTKSPTSDKFLVNVKLRWIIKYSLAKQNA